ASERSGGGIKRGGGGESWSCNVAIALTRGACIVSRDQWRREWTARGAFKFLDKGCRRSRGGENGGRFA
ncbi:MAG: hypothetical protein LBD64_01420, partial [Odoribacteraceae bacterium]|nr:hypothetical protein [Odoribacteraceae bacterium]